jgi:hypothetical protein
LCSLEGGALAMERFSMARTYAEDIGLVTHFSPTRRQRQIRRRWMLVGAVALALGLGGLVSGLGGLPPGATQSAMVALPSR